jgi:hypothetical protein
LVDGVKYLLNNVIIKSENNKIILLIKIIISEDFKAITLLNLKKLQKKFKSQNIVIFISSVNRNKFMIYWKSKDIQQLLTLKPYGKIFIDVDQLLCEFAVEFLIKSLENGHLGKNEF